MFKFFIQKHILQRFVLMLVDKPVCTHLLLPFLTLACPHTKTDIKLIFIIINFGQEKFKLYPIYGSFCGPEHFYCFLFLQISLYNFIFNKYIGWSIYGWFIACLSSLHFSAFIDNGLKTSCGGQFQVVTTGWVKKYRLTSNLEYLFFNLSWSVKFNTYPWNVYLRPCIRTVWYKVNVPTWMYCVVCVQCSYGTYQVWVGSPHGYSEPQPLGCCRTLA